MKCDTDPQGILRVGKLEVYGTDVLQLANLAVRRACDALPQIESLVTRENADRIIEPSPNYNFFETNSLLIRGNTDRCNLQIYKDRIRQLGQKQIKREANTFHSHLQTEIREIAFRIVNYLAPSMLDGQFQVQSNHYHMDPCTEP